MDRRSLGQRVEQFIEYGDNIGDLSGILKACVDDDSMEAMGYVRRLFEDMYDGMTFNVELKASAAAVLLHWKDSGLEALVEGSRRVNSSKNNNIVMQLLASVAADEGLPALMATNQVIDQLVVNAFESFDGRQEAARAKLVEFVLSFEDEENLSQVLGLAMMSFSLERIASSKELFNAVSKRWLAVSTPVLEAFEKLINNSPNSEPAFQKFLTQHPQLLDPIATKVWPQPNLFGFKKPDFIVQKADGSYLVIEIECPGKLIVIKKGQLSAAATHAENQANEYRHYIQSKSLSLESHFPALQELDALVVIGLEKDLNTTQARALRNVHNGRHRLRIVGFDWLLERAKTVASNVTVQGVEVCQLRAV